MSGSMSQTVSSSSDIRQPGLELIKGHPLGEVSDDLGCPDPRRRPILPACPIDVLLSGHPDPPFILVLGNALASFRGQLDALRAETDACEKTSLSTAFSLTEREDMLGR
jgi:hypothetical protein